MFTTFLVTEHLRQQNKRPLLVISDIPIESARRAEIDQVIRNSETADLNGERGYVISGIVGSTAAL